MDVGDQVTRLIGGIVPEQQEITRINPLAGTVHCGELTFDMDTGMEMNDDEEWGPKYEKTNSYLKEILDAHKKQRAYIRRVREADQAARAQDETEG